MKRSHEPLAWALFGAGGMLSALAAPALIVITGVLAPLLWPQLLDRTRLLALLQPAPVRVALGLVIALFLWHGAHRVLHGLHDLGLRTGRWGAAVFYGGAALGALAAAGLLARLGA